MKYIELPGDLSRMGPSERLSVVPGLHHSSALDLTHVTGNPAPLPAPASVPGATARLAGLDLLRIAGALGVIWFHVGTMPSIRIGCAGLPIFLLIYFSLIVKQGSAHTTAEFLQRRWDRLLKPWLFWSAVYGVGWVAKAVCTRDWGPLVQMLSLGTLFTGTYIHLWYLPYAFGTGLLLHTINRRLAKASDAPVIIGALLVGVLMLVASSTDLYTKQWPVPLPQWELGLPALPLGLALGRALTLPSQRRRVRFLSLVSLITVGACVLLALLSGSPAIPYGLAIGLVGLIYVRPIPSNALVAAVAPLMLGIYLIHPLIAWALVHAFLPPGHGVALALLTTACLSGAITWGLQRTPLKRFI